MEALPTRYCPGCQEYLCESAFISFPERPDRGEPVMCRACNKSEWIARERARQEAAGC